MHDIAYSPHAEGMWQRLSVQQQRNVLTCLQKEVAAQRVGRRRAKRLKKDPTRFTLRVGRLRVIYCQMPTGVGLVVVNVDTRANVYNH